MFVENADIKCIPDNTHPQPQSLQRGRSLQKRPRVSFAMHNTLFAPLAEPHQDEIVTEGVTDGATDGRGRGRGRRRVIHLRKSRPSLPLFLGDGTRRRLPKVEGNGVDSVPLFPPQSITKAMWVPHVKLTDQHLNDEMCF